ncbi:ABC transporter substrate-binding protein [Alkalicoccobacillus porphyridii]|nr:aliphatic sulfonate ABC transporter substrate-binding protein [Alkalicoccobacillus porphyridii]
MKLRNMMITLAGLGLITTGCGTSGSNGEPAEEVRIGYFPNLTHISTIIALENGYFEEELGEDITIDTRTFPDGGVFMEAMGTDAIDVGTVGPTPVINNYIKNPTFEIIAGAVNGGAVLEVRNDAGIDSVEDLDGKRVAIPTIGSTQDIMLMKELQDHGMDVNSSGGTVNTVPQAPADTAALFLGNDVDAAATQEPWGINLETHADAKLLLGPEEFAWGEDSTNTVLAARQDFTEENPELTQAILSAYVRAVDFINENPDEAIDLFINHIQEITGKELTRDEIEQALERTFPTYEINEDILTEMASIIKEAGYSTSDDIDGLINLDYLQEVLNEQ